MNLTDCFTYDQLFAGRNKPRRVPLGWDWSVARAELLFSIKPKTKQLLAQARQVQSYGEEYAVLPQERLDEELNAARILIRLKRESEEQLLRAVALVGEMAFRIRGEKPHLPQIAGALGILQNCIVEMATGEGKTLTAALAAVIAGWRGKGCHVVTSNDYLAARDAETMTDFFKACLLVCGSITQDNSPEERKAAYGADITYLTSKEATADFLRDQMTLGLATSHTRLLAQLVAGEKSPMLVQRGLFCAIVDEVDSVLCDGGSTPLIISVPKENAPSVDQYLTASTIVTPMKIGRHFLVNRAFREVRLTDYGHKKVMDTLKGRAPAWARRTRAVELVLQALEAREFFEVSVQYVVQEGKVVIVDEATGRIMPDHEWRDGIHQAVAAKEGLEVVPPRATSAQSTFQDFFLRYKVLGGMTGTAWEARKEFLQFYRLSVVRIPTHRPCIRYRSYRAFYTTQEEKIREIAVEAQREHAKGRAVLVGTKSIGSSEEISRALTQIGLHHEVLNAVQHEREAEIISLAGCAKSVTVATNMAGRGTDIKLESGVRESGGLHVILTELHDSSRVDRQLYGRSGRQGDPGSVADIISLSDDLFATIPLWVKRLLHLLLRVRHGRRITTAIAWKIAALCQWLGDGKAFSRRKQMVQGNRHFVDMISYSGKKT